MKLLKVLYCIIGNGQQEKKTLYSVENSAAHMQECWSSHLISAHVMNLLFACVLFSLPAFSTPSILPVSVWFPETRYALLRLDIRGIYVRCGWKDANRAREAETQHRGPGSCIVEFMTDTDWLPLGRLSCLRPALRIVSIVASLLG